MPNSRQKGKRGELELSHFLTDRGVPARRGQQFSGSGDSPDVVAELPGMHIECKRTERFQLYPALEQATFDTTGTTKMPIVFHRSSRKPWTVVIWAEDFLKLVASR